MKIKIYQIKDTENIKNALKDLGKSTYKNFDFSDYVKTYEYEVEPETAIMEVIDWVEITDDNRVL